MMNHLGQPFSIRSALVAVFHTPPTCNAVAVQCRHFHEYFVTHLPSSSLSPDRQQSGTSHKLPRDESQPHSGRSSRSAARIPQDRNKQHRDTTIVRIPIKSAKHHFGAGVSRGSRPYNEDTYQGGTIEIPAFAKRQPISLSRSKKDAFSLDEGGGGQQSAMSEVGDPQVFYFGVFDGHGGTECSEFLRDRLHGYIEEAALLFGMESSLQRGDSTGDEGGAPDGEPEGGVLGHQDADDLQKSVVQSWKETVGGYFKRFRPEYFPAVATAKEGSDTSQKVSSNSMETVLTYAFLKAFTPPLPSTQPHNQRRSIIPTLTRLNSKLDHILRSLRRRLRLLDHIHDLLVLQVTAHAIRHEHDEGVALVPTDGRKLGPDELRFCGDANAFAGDVAEGARVGEAEHAFFAEGVCDESTGISSQACAFDGGAGVVVGC